MSYMLPYFDSSYIRFHFHQYIAQLYAPLRHTRLPNGLLKSPKIKSKGAIGIATYDFLLLFVVNAALNSILSLSTGANISTAHSTPIPGTFFQR